VERAREHRSRFLVKFEGVDSREEAELVKGTLYVPADKARDLDDGEYWERDVVGCSVVTADGTTVGTVTEVIPGPAQDLLEIDTARGPRLIPFVAEIVTEVDPGERRVVIDPPEGLLE
jgi:16S rRNA processing protein RimM